MIDEADFLIIGGGMAGAGVAYFLARSGRRAIVLERETAPGYHASGRSAALLHVSYGPPAVRALTLAATPFLRSPPAGFAAHPLLARRGSLTFCAPGQEARLDAALEDARAVVPSAQRLDRAQTLARCPALRAEAVGATLWEPEVADIDVHALLAGFLRGAKAGGGRLVGDAEVLALENAGGRWVAETRAGRFAAPVVIDAAGAWADDVAALAGVAPLGLTPKRRTVITFDPPEGLDLARLPLVGDLDDDLYFKPEGGRLMASPSDETPSPPCDAQAEELDVAIVIDRLERATTLAPRRIVHRRAGLRSFVADGVPAVGPAADAEGFFWLAGQGGYGIETAPALCHLAAALVTGEPPPADLAAAGLDPATLAPTRATLTAL